MSAGTPTSPGFPLGYAVGSSAAASMVASSPRAAAAAVAAASLASRPGSNIGSRPGTPSSAGLANMGSMGGISVDEVRKWTQAEVAAWLHSLRLGAHATTFAKHDILGSVLLDVDQGSLKEMGITAVGDRIRVFTAIKNLRKRCAETAAMNTLSRVVPPPRAVNATDSEMEYLHDVSTHSTIHDYDAAGLGGRRSQLVRPPPLHLSQSSAQDMPITPTAPSPSGSLSNGQGLGLKEMRGLAQQAGQGRTLNGSIVSRSPVGLHKPLPDVRDESLLGHRKMSSNGGVAGLLGAQNPRAAYGYGPSGGMRPSTATGSSYAASAGSRAGHGLTPGSSSSPTSATFGVSRPSTADTVRIHHGSAASNLANNPLTPITEMSRDSPTTPLYSATSVASVNRSERGYAVGHGPFAASASGRPITPRVIDASSAASNASYGAQASLEDLKRQIIKFIGEDGTTRTVNVSDCRDAYDVLARVLKKFGKSVVGNSYTPTAGQTLSVEDHEYDDGETWGIFATSGEGKTKSLTDNELLAICHAPQPHDPLRERGLTLRRLGPKHDHGGKGTASAPRRNKLESFFGERMPGHAGGNPGEGDHMEAHTYVPPTGKKVNRASTVSIMSGLGVVAKGSKPPTAWGATPPLPGRPELPNRSPTSVIPRKARNFFGQRPPSELISSHLTDYFPQAEKRVLERTARRSIYGRPSASVRSKRDSTWSFTADADAPPLPGKESFESRHNPPSIYIGTPEDSDDGHTSSSASQHQPPPAPKQASKPPTLPPVIGRSSLDDWSKSLQTVGSPVEESPPTLTPLPKAGRPLSQRRASGESARSSRKSLATQLRAARGISSSGTSNLSGQDRSDAASMLTVDEITQQVEDRRASMHLAGAGGGWVVDEDGVPIPVRNAGRKAGSIIGSTRPQSTLSVSVSGEDAEDADEAEEEEQASGPGRSSSRMSVPGEETDHHAGDPMAVTRSATSRASSVSELQHDMADDGEEDEELSEDEMVDEEDEDLSGEEEDEEQGIFHSAVPGKDPIKWIKGALIGAGSFGNVFLGMNAKNGLLMAVKQVELPSGDSKTDQRKKSMLEALEREIELLKTMQHENIVQYLDSSADSTHLNIFLEYVPGGSVVALLRNYGAFEELLVRNFVRQILQGLSYLHAREIVHRDIKGANILVDNKSCVKISDFGISKKVESDLLVSARAHRPSLQGSVFWMAPEVVKQTSYTRKADIWSLGCLVVEMISGTHPWANLNQMQALFKIGSFAKPTLPDDVSQDCINFLNATFELDHNKRPSADELLQHPFIVGEYTGPANASGSSADDPNSASSIKAASSGAATVSSATGAGNTVKAKKQSAAAARRARDAVQAPVQDSADTFS
ncbi:Pkinase-domain-containing protein [Ceraceosorus guamensis]|uniref:Pkinase-domain-containing protein n=1 Tax=Ceraceosorus guamensis TaxID=1522189 RepID=A0A316VPU0_9BASI|nr:Pkinase-domain-containing protein [Ceraceosorus guamensis]PWN39350.1 Pkinase-domain-containing protein [Ceraceosorus guamensis]